MGDDLWTADDLELAEVIQESGRLSDERLDRFVQQFRVGTFFANTADYSELRAAMIELRWRRKQARLTSSPEQT